MNDRALRVAVALGSSGPGGAEMVVLQLCTELRTRGTHITPILLAGGPPWLAERLQERGFTPQYIRLGRGWIDPGCVHDLLRVLRTHQVDVLHSHEFDMAVYGTVASMFARIPNVITMHGGTTVTNAVQRRIALRWAFRRSTRAVAVSEGTRGQFIEGLGAAGESMMVVHNGVVVAEGDPARVRAEFGVQSGETVLLAVGTLDRNKGHSVLLDALVQLERERPRAWRLIIAGGRGGAEHQALLDQARAGGVDARVHIVTGRSDVADLQALADIFVMPSLWEGLPMALLEAMVAGNAIVASATGGIPEAVRDGRDGLLVPPGDPVALSLALRRLLDDPAHGAPLGASARARARQEFTVQVMAARYESVYRDALAPSGARTA
jgi:glycosyltransferase involved in cell wall biosynthesis